MAARAGDPAVFEAETASAAAELAAAAEGMQSCRAAGRAWATMIQGEQTRPAEQLQAVVRDREQLKLELAECEEQQVRLYNKLVDAQRQTEAQEQQLDDMQARASRQVALHSAEVSALRRQLERAVAMRPLERVPMHLAPGTESTPECREKLSAVVHMLTELVITNGAQPALIVSGRETATARIVTVIEMVEELIDQLPAGKKAPAGQAFCR
jgi:hypothetical protein